MGSIRSEIQIYVICLLIWHSLCEANASKNPYELREEYDICNPNIPDLVPPLAYLSEPGDSTQLYIHLYNHNPRKCELNFKTCANCQVGVRALNPTFDSCPWTDIRHSYDGKCITGCSYLYLIDDDYKNQTTKVVQKSKDIGSYHSQSRNLRVIACLDRIDEKPENTLLQIFSQKKQMTIKGSHLHNNVNYVTSPFFPSPCIQNGETYTYDIKSVLEPAYISITFEDWIVSPYSYFKFSQANIRGNINGRHPRPYIVSDKPETTMTFYTGDYRIPGTYFSFLGFRAAIRFFQSQEEIPNVQTDCGGIIEETGGIIQLNERIANGEVKDCIWLVKKPYGYEGVQLGVEKFVNYSDHMHHPHLEIRKGLTSLATEENLGSLFSHFKMNAFFRTLGEGFYIRLRGRIFRSDSLVMTFAAYRSGDVHDCRHKKEEVFCKNWFCIDRDLACDGHNHCGDNSDESTSLCRTNYDTRDNSHVGVQFVVPLVVVLVVVVIFCVFVLFLRRCRRLARQQPPPTPRSNGRGRRRSRQSVQMSVTVSSGECLPSYNEVIRSTPRSDFSMVISQTPDDYFALQPPSYEEAMEAENFDLSLSSRQESADFNDLTSHNLTAETFLPETPSSSNTLNILSPKHRASGFSVACAASADLSSSSSSDGSYERDRNLESNQSESSSDNDDSMFAQAFFMVNPNSVHVSQAVYMNPPRRDEDRGNSDRGERGRRRNRRRSNRRRNDTNQLRENERGEEEGHVQAERDPGDGRTDNDRVSVEQRNNGKMIAENVNQYQERPPPYEYNDNEHRGSHTDSGNRNSGSYVDRSRSYNSQTSGNRSRSCQENSERRMDENGTRCRSTDPRHQDERGSRDTLLDNHGPRTEAVAMNEDSDAVSNSAAPLFVTDDSVVSENYDDDSFVSVDGIRTRSTFV